MKWWKLIKAFIVVSAKQEMAYRVNFWISLLQALLNLGTGVIGLGVIFSQVETIRGWAFADTLALMGVFLIVSALRGLFIGPGMETVAGLGQEVMTGGFDFVLIRPVHTQFLVTFRTWRLFSLVDLALGAGVLAWSLQGSGVEPAALLLFGVALLAAVLVVYAVLLAMTALTFWSPGLMLNWVFDAVFQLARYPVSIYPPWLRFILTWCVPVGVMTTIPAQAITGQNVFGPVMGGLGAALTLTAGASWLFSRGLRRYGSASS